MEKRFDGERQHREEFPDDFITRVKREFPNWADLHTYVEAGDVLATKRCLSDHLDFQMKPDEIVEAIKGGDQNRVLEAAEKTLRIKQLYSELSDLERSHTQ